MEIAPSSQEPIQVPITDIEDNPYQIRTTYDESQLTALAVSIQEVGLLQTPMARKVGNTFQLAFGHRRKRAIEQLYRTHWAARKPQTMPLIIVSLTDREMFEISIAENLKRADVGPLERAEALKRYMTEFNATSPQAAQLFGIPEGTIRGTIRLLNLPAEAKKQMRAGKLSQHQARRILQKPEAQAKRFEPDRDGQFNLREKLMILVYDRKLDYVTDELLFKKIREIVDQNEQLQRQVELMNASRREAVRTQAPAPIRQ